jgi:hypothetical protein
LVQRKGSRERLCDIDDCRTGAIRFSAVSVRLKDKLESWLRISFSKSRSKLFSFVQQQDGTMSPLLTLFRQLRIAVPSAWPSSRLIRYRFVQPKSVDRSERNIRALMERLEVGAEI